MAAFFVGSIWLRLSLRESLMISSLSTLPMFGMSVLSECGRPHSTKIGASVGPAASPGAQHRKIAAQSSKSLRATAPVFPTSFRFSAAGSLFIAASSRAATD
ncbi:MAG: hypothetical protein U0805_23465 [Pirellulales bacterium]